MLMQKDMISQNINDLFLIYMLWMVIWDCAMVDKEIIFYW